MKKLLFFVILITAINLSAEEALFSVTNDSTPPDTIFAVYPSGIKVLGEDGEAVMIANRDSIRMYIDETPVVGRSSRGGFAVGGVASRTFLGKYLTVEPDSTRIYFNEEEGRSSRGGFAVGGVASRNRSISEYLSIKTDKTSINVKDSDEGFSVGNIDTGGTNKFLDLTSQNYFIGHGAGAAIEPTAFYNQFIGYEAGLKTTTGDYNMFIGYQSGYENTIGYDNLFMGYRSGYSNVDGMNNIFIGKNSGYQNTEGPNNIFIGENSGYNNSDGNNNIFIGEGSGQDNTVGFYNTFIGYRSGYRNGINPNPPYSGSYRNVYLGAFSGHEGVVTSSNVCVGYSSGRYVESGNSNTLVGNEAGHGGVLGTTTFATYSGNSFFGSNAGYLTTVGNNSFFGNLSGYNNTNGTYNSFFGGSSGKNKSAGSYNTMIGHSSGEDNGTGTKNTFVGFQSGMNNTDGDTNVFIGYRAGREETGSDKLYIENSDSATPLIHGDFDTDVVTINDVLKLAPRGSAPTPAVEGMMYYNSTSHMLLVFDGNYWRPCW